MYFTAYKSCSRNQGDDKCVTSSAVTTSRCERLPQACGSSLVYYRDSDCAMIYETYIVWCMHVLAVPNVMVSMVGLKSLTKDSYG